MSKLTYSKHIGAVLGGREPHTPDSGSWTMNSVMPFGKHRGQVLCDLPTDYIQWLVSELLRMNDKPRLCEQLPEILSQRQTPGSKKRQA